MKDQLNGAIIENGRQFIVHRMQPKSHKDLMPEYRVSQPGETV